MNDEQPETMTLEERQVELLQKRLQAEVDAHNNADNERQMLEAQLAAKRQELDRRYGKVVALQELLQEAGAPFAPGLPVAGAEDAAQAATAENGAGTPEAAAQALDDAAPIEDPKS